MSQLFSLSAEQLERIKPFFPLSHGISRVDEADSTCKCNTLKVE